MIYLDNNATTSVDPIVLQEMLMIINEYYANPSSLHEFGHVVNNKLSAARKIVADRMGCYEDEIIFTSSGSEGNNMCLKGFAFSNKHRGNHIITSKIEHPSIISTCEYLSKNGFEVTYLDVDDEGSVSPSKLKDAVKDNTILISIGHVNSEIGIIQDLNSLINVKGNVKFHTDAVQGFLKTDFSIKKYNVDMATISGHKFHAPKGVGFIYRKRGIEISPQTHGGMQEFGLRAGTENIPLICALAKAIEIYDCNHIISMKNLQKYLIDSLTNINGIIINGPNDLERRVCTNINISSESFEGIFLLKQLSKQAIFVSTGSACSSKYSKVSHVLAAIRCNPRYIQGNIRISLSKYTTEKCIDTFIRELKLIFNNKTGMKLIKSE